MNKGTCLKKSTARCKEATTSASRINVSIVSKNEDQNDELRAIEFPRIAGGKPFNIDEAWFDDLLASIGQTKGAKVEVAH